MKRFLIATAIAALVAPTLAAPSFAQDNGGRGGRGGRGDGQFQGQGRQGGGGGNFDRGDRGDRGGGRQFNGGGNPGAQAPPQAVQPAPQAAPAAPQAQFQGRGERGNRQFQGQGQRPDRGQFQGQVQGGQFQGRQDRGDRQFQGQGQRQFQGQNQGQRQFQGQGQRQFQGQPNFNQGRQGFSGRNDNRFDNRQGFDNRRFDNRRYQGPAPRGGQRFSYNGRDFYRFRSTPYRWPGGYNNYGSLSWSLNQLLPSIFLNQSYYIDPYQYGLPWADPGYQWVQVGNDALLIDSYTGMIVDMVPGVFYW